MALEGRSGGDGICAAGEGSDVAFLVVLQNLEVLGGEITDVIAFLVGDDGVHTDCAGFGVDYLLGIAGRLRAGRRGINLLERF